MNKPQQIQLTSPNSPKLFWSVACGAFKKNGTYFQDVASAAEHFKEAVKIGGIKFVKIVDAK